MAACLFQFLLKGVWQQLTPLNFLKYISLFFIGFSAACSLLLGQGSLGFCLGSVVTHPSAYVDEPSTMISFTYYKKNGHPSSCILICRSIAMRCAIFSPSSETPHPSGSPLGSHGGHKLPISHGILPLTIYFDFPSK